mgnify:FL=1
MSDFTDRIIDGPEMPPRGRYWKTKFQEERRAVEQKNKVIAELRAENTALRAALKPILARIEMPRNGCSHTQYVMIQASELVVLQAALAGKENEG